MMLIGSPKEPCNGGIRVLLGAESTLKIDTEHSLCGCIALFGGMTHQTKRCYSILVVTCSIPATLLLIIVRKLELCKGIVEFRRRSAEPFCDQFAPPETTTTQFFYRRPQHERAWLALIIRRFEQPFLPENDISIGVAWPSYCITSTQMKPISDGACRVSGQSTATSPLRRLNLINGH